MLEIKGLQSGYGYLQVLWDVSLELNDGEFIVLLGSNGAGKTTTLRTISGVIRPISGEINFLGQSIGGKPGHEISRLGISFITEDLNLFPKMTVYDNLLVGAYSVRDKKKIKETLAYILNLFPRLEERLNQLAGTLSGGERKMLAIGRGLMPNPKLLLVDEPSLGLSPLMTRATFDALRKLNQDGTTILLVEQHLGKALEITNRGYILEQGKVVMEAPTATLLESERVKEVYLGR
ncbi:MAG: ABC transporter ATP-binding protein [Anaerolineales bacterium]|nr:ABC transporter ATP-binding protein [Anaerolineales bacterium]